MKNLNVLRKGMKSELVGDWQAFLRDLKFYQSTIDNDFGKKTFDATILFQNKHKLYADGVVGSDTWSKAIALGFHLDIQDEKTGINSLNFPPKPNFPPLVSNTEREKLFGRITFLPKPTLQNPEAITITNNFESINIVKVNLPQLNIATNGKYSSMRFHKDCVYQLEEFFKELEAKNLLQHIKSFGGAYYPRFIRGSRSVLSNHSYGTAFDINVPWNGLGKTPALVGQTGSVREIVPIAIKWGFYWGGHFSRPDGMHFEIAKIIRQ
jgi:hypothetical protein